VSYRALNKFTKPFTYPIPRCSDAIENLNVDDCLALLLWFIAVHGHQGFHQGFHQIWIIFFDEEKTTFFTPDGDKECFQVMHFGPTNGPTTYTIMMY
jgi:hypothetical protein